MIWRTDKVETDRLILRNFRRRDVSKLPLLLDNWAIARWLARVPYPYGSSDAKEWVRLSRSICRSGRGLPLAVVQKERGDLIGGVGVSFKDGEIGYWLGEAYWGQGYASEAVSALIDKSFSSSALPCLWAAVRPGNDGSCRVLEKAGFLSKGTRAYQFRDGKVQAHYYVLERTAWMARL